MIVDYNYKINSKGITFSGATFYEYTAKGNKGFIYTPASIANFNDGIDDDAAYVSSITFTSPNGSDVKLNIDFTTDLRSSYDGFAQFMIPGSFIPNVFTRAFSVLRLPLYANSQNYFFPITFKKIMISTAAETVPATWYRPVQFFPIY
jgi:hypothetical protein